ncbi:Ig-like domain-containing protein, partial [Lacrimispora saccharolytica]|nr:Ig-like domain-containing protein [Lacrimispora saccharolytica]
SGVTGQCKVKVQKKAVEVAGLDISLAGLRGGQLILKKGQSVTCKATVKPFTCKTKVTYSSGNSKIAKILKNGKIRAVKNGKTKITIRAGKKKKVIWVTVKK